MRDFTLFISYSQHDGREYAERLNDLIRSVFSDIRVFWDAQIFAGEGLWDRLHEEVRHCNVFLYLVSDQSTTMPSGCIREFSWARFYEKHVIPCVLPTYSGDPPNFTGFPELGELLYMDLRNGIENCTGELARLYGTLYESILHASPITQFHRREMVLLYEILDKISDDSFGNTDIRLGMKVYERGFELEYDEYPMIEGRVSRAVCMEVIEILDMMDYLQHSWKSFSEEEKRSVDESVGRPVKYRVMNVGFCGNHESAHLSYMRFLIGDGKFTGLSLASDKGNSHMRNLPKYRAMLATFSRIKHDDDNDFFTGGERFLLSVNEVIRIIQAQNGVLSHPL